MEELSNNIIESNSKYRLTNLKENILDYMVNFNVNDISWKSLTKEEIKTFINDNYVINNNLISWDNNTILGMHYLDKNLYSDKYFIGTIKNKLNKETIIGCISYYDYHQIYGNVNYISTVEINYFYQGHGLLKIMYQEFVKELDSNKEIIITNESLAGRRCHVISNLKKVLQKNNYNSKITIDD